MAPGIILFEDIFVVRKLIKEEAFDKVTRIGAKSENYDMFMLLDVNTEIYPMIVGDRFQMVLAYTLNLDGTSDAGYYNQEKNTLADSYEYVMSGKLYRIADAKEGTSSSTPKEGTSDESARRISKLEINVSFGGLLMMLKGNPSYMSEFKIDQFLHLLIRKI
ncbi:hypothetical protein REPUB_Repub13aG0049400 [Reevesia pubescens]